VSTNRYSILSFHSSKIYPLNFSISIFELLAISLHLKNQYHISPTVTRLITVPSQTLDHKGIPLKPIISLIPNANFNLVQYYTANKFSIKEHKRYNGKYKHYTYIFPLETQNRENHHILYSFISYIVYNTIYI
jgi:hypothetical protein